MKNLSHFNVSLGVPGVFIALSILCCTYAVYASHSRVGMSNECQAATLVLPELPTYLTCAEAAAYVAPDAWYDNNETGVCENNGYISATVIYPDLPCGLYPMEVIYDGFDDFGNPLYASVFINVDMAPEPTYYVPDIPDVLTCEEAAIYQPPTVTYSNGETGMCERSGSFNASFMVSEWDCCAGGFIYFYYDHMDVCLDYFYPTFIIDVLPAQPVLIMPYFPDTLTVTEAASYMPPEIVFSNGLSGDCGIYLSLPPADFLNVWDASSGGYILLTYTTYLPWLDDIYFTIIRIEVVPDEIIIVVDEFCSMGQGAYGNPGGMYCNGQSQREVMDELLLSNGGMVLGLPCNNRSFTIPEDGGQCIEDILPGGGQAAVLSGNFGCGNFGPLLKNGRLKNKLLAQTITMQLNLWLSPGLGDVILESNDFITVGSTGCGEGSSNGSTPLQDTLYYSIPQQVYDHLTNMTIQEIFNLANEALGTSHWPSGNPSLSAVADAVATINEAFDGCRFIYFPENLRSEPVIATAVAGSIDLIIAPNPFMQSTEITFSTNNDSKVYAEIYDLQGRLITRLFEGYMPKGTTKTLHYTAGQSRAPVICVIRAGNAVKHQVMLNLKR